jgi:hypothetical protein
MIGEIFSGIDAGKVTEISDKVSLVKITAVESDIGPDDRAATGEAAKDTLKAADATEEFGGQANALLEQFDKATGAITGFRGDLVDARGLRSNQKIRDGVFDGRVRVEGAGRALKESKFNGAEFSCGRGSGEDTLAKFARKTAQGSSRSR